MSLKVLSKRQKRLAKWFKSSCIVAASVGAFFLAQQFVLSQSELVQRASPLPLSSVSIPAQIDELIDLTRPSLSPEIETHRVAGDYELAKNILMNRAAQAAGALDNAGLALSLGELGELSLQQGELGMAEVYLSEAIEILEELGDEVGVAGMHVQVGRLHLHRRQRARQTSDAYDQLLISRWMISKGRFYETESQLKDVVRSNLELHRYGAAASAYETLYSGYSKNASALAAEDAGKEAIKLHAASGNVKAAHALLEEMNQSGLSLPDAELISQQINSFYREYEASVQAIGQARDYAQLYNQLSSRGDALQAWRFRQKAQQSLANASSRARYRRQPDVLVELYRSNVSMHNAKTSLQKANAVYSRHGIAEGVELSNQLQAQIY